MKLAVAKRATPVPAPARHQVRAPELVEAVAEQLEQTRVLSLDCFDTLVWRQTAAPTDVFFDLERADCFRARGFTAKLRMSAEATARDLRRVRSGSTEVRLSDIYRAAFPALTDEEVAELSEAELAAEIRACYAFPATMELIRATKAAGLRIIVVSDTYFDSKQLRRLIAAVAPEDVAGAIDRIFCSCELGRSKADGLFEHVLELASVKASRLLHVGDNRIADYVAPTAAGARALHLQHHDSGIEQALRLEGAAASLLEPSIRGTAPLPSPFRGVLAAVPCDDNDARDLLGYAAAGPIFYSFGRFVLDELEAMRAEGKRPKPLFLMRDAYLPQQVCNAIAGREVGHAVAISRFAAYAASFRTAADVDRYLARFASSKRFADITRQLLLPEPLAREVAAAADRCSRPVEEIGRQVRRPKVLATIIEQSRAYRERLRRYLEATAGIEEGDTLVFIDLGYEGTAQRELEPVFRDEWGIDVVGRYLMTVRTPGWEHARRGLIDPSWCDDRTIAALVQYVALIEDLCTSDDASVVDYDDQGRPVLAEHVIAREQFERIKPIQARCCELARDAEAFFAATGKRPDAHALRTAALGAIGRILFFPMEREIEYLEGFRLDMNLATIDSFRLFDREQGLTGLRRRGLFFMERNLGSLRTNYPIELRSAGLELTTALLAQHRYAMELVQSDLTLRREQIPVVVVRGDESSSATLDARATHDGFFALLAPVGRCEIDVGVLFGQRYRWVQIESVELVEAGALFGDDESARTIDASSCVSAEGLVDHGGGLFECESDGAFLLVAPRSIAARSARDGAPAIARSHVCRIVFRPISPR